MMAEANLQRGAVKDERIFRFGKGLDGNACLASGWGEPERGFVWSEGKIATISLPALAGAAELSVSAWGYVPKGMVAQEVLFFVDGIFKGLFEIDEKRVITVTHEQGEARKPVTLLFYIPTATSPAQAEGSTDRRRLGIALSALQLTPFMT